MVPGSATTNTRVDGFVIRNGTGYESDVGRFGGGIYCYLASPTIANNTFTLNTADDGGGGIYCEESSAVITDNTFTGNSSGFGGGICCYSATPTIARNTVVSNAAGYGGGIYCESSSATISGNIVARNSADYGYGGGIYCDYYSSPPIVNNMVTGNSAASGYGAGIFCDWYSSPIIVNNVLAGNIADNGLGGGIYLEWYASPTIANNTITANSAYLGGAVYCYYAAPVIANTIVAYNSSGICRAGGDSPSLRYNCVFGNISYDYSGLGDPTGADGNIAAQPKFVRQAGPGMDGLWATADDDYGDLHLLPGSRCIDAGGNAEVPPDAADLNGNGNTAELTPIDLAAGPRFANDPAAPDTGSGSAPIVDIGAYEYHPGDATGDGHVDASDLLVLAAAWGRLAGDPIYDPRCDMNVDNAVDVSDLLILAFNWGA
jgi:parallel beta-helix repeat protein/predicted outer membrane repeat protein